MRRTPVYLVGKPTGLINEDSIESIIVIGVKLTRLAAEELSKQYPDSIVVKRYAEK
jgi:hypothetical protein